MLELEKLVKNVKQEGKSWSDERLEEARAKLLAWRAVVTDGIDFITALRAERIREAGKRQQLLRAILVVSNVDPQSAEQLRQKHNITDQELEEFVKSGARVRQTSSVRTAKEGGVVHGVVHVVLDEDGKPAYRNAKGLWPLFRSFSKSLKTGHATVSGSKESFDFVGFKQDVLGVGPGEEVRPGHTWTYAGKTWRYDVTAG